jgi:hypothetical protein
MRAIVAIFKFFQTDLIGRGARRRESLVETNLKWFSRVIPFNPKQKWFVTQCSESLLLNSLIIRNQRTTHCLAISLRISGLTCAQETPPLGRIEHVNRAQAVLTSFFFFSPLRLRGEQRHVGD